jgi:SAM-dependent methyltransferase
MKETTKSNKVRRQFDRRFVEEFFVGSCIDIGCGNDPIKKSEMFPNIISVTTWDKDKGDAQTISLDQQFDFVYSSNCLEHLHDPVEGLQNWWKLVKPNGYLIVVVPDEDLYEQGEFPSKRNPDHKKTFTIYKDRSWSNESVNVIDLIKTLHSASIQRIVLADTNYDYSLEGVDQTRKNAEAFIEFVVKKDSHTFKKLA